LIYEEISEKSLGRLEKSSAPDWKIPNDAFDISLLFSGYRSIGVVVSMSIVRGCWRVEVA